MQLRKGSDERRGQFLTSLAPLSFAVTITRRMLCCNKIFHAGPSSRAV